MTRTTRNVVVLTNPVCGEPRGRLSIDWNCVARQGVWS